MVVIVGMIVVVGSVLGGFTMAGGHVSHLIHPSEIVTIGGASLGSLIIMSSSKMLKDLVHGTIVAIKGSPYNKAAYTELFKLMYELLRMTRRDGLLALEPHINNAHGSELFKKYPKIANDHHMMDFIKDGLAPYIDGSAKAETIKESLETEISAMEAEHHHISGLMQKTADGLPGFGIVAAVLGIVITMGAIDGPVEEIGHKVGAALVGTFLGILMSYGFIGPIAAKMESVGAKETEFLKTIATMIVWWNEVAPVQVLEQARRSIGAEDRFSREELETLLKSV